MDEQLYTLEQAREVLARQECGSRGHDYDVVTVIGASSPSHIYCARCGGAWPVVRDHADVRVDGEGQRVMPSDDIASLVIETIDLGGTVKFIAMTPGVEIVRVAPGDVDVRVRGTDLRDAMAKYRTREAAS